MNVKDFICQLCKVIQNRVLEFMLLDIIYVICRNAKSCFCDRRFSYHPKTNTTFLFPCSTSLTGTNFYAHGFHFQGSLIDFAFLYSPNHPSMIIIPLGKKNKNNMNKAALKRCTCYYKAKLC